MPPMTGVTLGRTPRAGSGRARSSVVHRPELPARPPVPPHCGRGGRAEHPIFGRLLYQGAIRRFFFSHCAGSTTNAWPTSAATLAMRPLWADRGRGGDPARAGRAAARTPTSHRSKAWSPARCRSPATSPTRRSTGPPRRRAGRRGQRGGRPRPPDPRPGGRLRRRRRACRRRAGRVRPDPGAVQWTTPPRLRRYRRRDPPLRRHERAGRRRAGRPGLLDRRPPACPRELRRRRARRTGGALPGGAWNTGEPAWRQSWATPPWDTPSPAARSARTSSRCAVPASPWAPATGACRPGRGVYSPAPPSRARSPRCTGSPPRRGVPPAGRAHRRVRLQRGRAGDRARRGESVFLAPRSSQGPTAGPISRAYTVRVCSRGRPAGFLVDALNVSDQPWRPASRCPSRTRSPARSSTSRPCPPWRRSRPTTRTRWRCSTPTSSGCS